MHLNATSRSLWDIVLIASIILGGALTTLLNRRSKVPDSALAAEIEQTYPVLKERLLTSVELAPAMGIAAQTGSFSVPMIASLIEETRTIAASLDFSRAVKTLSLRRASTAAALTILLLIIQIGASPEAFSIWLKRMASPRADIAPFARTRVWITPEVNILPRGENLKVQVTTRGDYAAGCTLEYHMEGDLPSNWKKLSEQAYSKIKDSSEQAFNFRIPALNKNILLQAKANDGESNQRQVEVEDRPTPLNFIQHIHFPAYMHRSSQQITESTGNVGAPVGSVVEITASANKPLKTALFTQLNGADKSWQISGIKASGAITVVKNGSYQLKLTDTRGFDNPNAPHYQIIAQPDLSPQVQIDQPAADIDLVPNGRLPLTAHATDDYGVAGMGLVFERQKVDPVEGERVPMHRMSHSTLALPGTFGSPQASISTRWNIASSGARPGEVLHYEVDAHDNDTLHGPHIGRSQAYNIRIVTLIEMQKRLKSQLDDEARALQQLQQDQSAAQNARNAAASKPTTAAVSRAQEAQQNAAQEARSLTEKLKQLTTQLENNGLSTDSESKRRDMAGETLQKLADQKMPAAAESIKPKQPMTEATKIQTDIQHDLNSVKQLLARPPTPEQLAQETARLAQEQQRLAESARNLGEDMRAHELEGGKKPLSADQKSNLQVERNQQAETNAATQKLQSQLERAASDAREHGNKDAAHALEKAAQALKDGAVGAHQNSAQKSLSQNRPTAAAPEQDRAAVALQKASEEAQAAAQSSSQPESPTAAADKLEQESQRLKEMADLQKQVANKTEQNPGQAESKNLAKQEQSLERQAAQENSALRSSPSAQKSLQSAKQSLNQAGKQLSKQNSNGAKSPAQNAAQQLQKASQQAASDAQQMRQQQAAQEMQERVERLAQIQRGLLQATQRVQTIREQKQVTKDTAREIGQLGARQESTEQQTRELSKMFPSPAFQKAMNMAANQMHPASLNLGVSQPDTGPQTQASQLHAAQTLETITQALKEQAKGGKPTEAGQDQQGDQQQGGGSPQESQKAAALGDLMLSRGIQQQLKDDTNALDRARAKDHDGQLTNTQKREANQLSEAQKDNASIAKQAGENLRDVPGLSNDINESTKQMEQASRQLFQQQTGLPTQQTQADALQKLDQAVKKAQQAAEQEQQKSQQQSSSQGTPQQAQQSGQGQPKPFSRLEQTKRGMTGAPSVRTGKGFAALNPRSQRSLQDGQQEKVPIEFQDLVHRYYKSLAQKGK